MVNFVSIDVVVLEATRIEHRRWVCSHRAALNGLPDQEMHSVSILLRVRPYFGSICLTEFDRQEEPVLHASPPFMHQCLTRCLRFEPAKVNQTETIQLVVRDRDALRPSTSTAHVVGRLHSIKPGDPLLGVRGANIYQCRRSNVKEQSRHGYSVHHHWDHADRKPDICKAVRHSRTRQSRREWCAIAQSLKQGAEVNRAQTGHHRANLGRC